MSVKIGKAELKGIQNIHSSETRNLVEQKIPGGSGNVFQNLGGEPVTINMEGIIVGDDVHVHIEELRQAHVKAKPLPFSADIAVGSDLTDVLIEDFRVAQAAGHKSRYRFTLKVREYIEPPQPPNFGFAAVNMGVLSDAKSWAADGMAIAAALNEPSSLPGLLKDRPDLLSSISMGDLSNSIVQNMNAIAGKDIGNVLKSVSGISPLAALEFIENLSEKGGIADMVQKFADEGLDLAENLTGIDLGNVSNVAGDLADEGLGLVENLTGIDLKKLVGVAGNLANITEFLKKLKNISTSASGLLNNLKDFDPFKELKMLKEGDYQ